MKASVPLSFLKQNNKLFKQQSNIGKPFSFQCRNYTTSFKGMNFVGTPFMTSFANSTKSQLPSDIKIEPLKDYEILQSIRIHSIFSTGKLLS